MKVKKSLTTKIFELVGEATMCWEPKPSGEFDSTKAYEIADKIVKLVKKKK